VFGAALIPGGSGVPYAGGGVPYAGGGAVSTGGVVYDGGPISEEGDDVPPGLAEYGSNAGVPSVDGAVDGGYTPLVPCGGYTPVPCGGYTPDGDALGAVSGKRTVGCDTAMSACVTTSTTANTSFARGCSTTDQARGK